jgi:hypothetical protein
VSVLRVKSFTSDSTICSSLTGCTQMETDINEKSENVRNVSAHISSTRRTSEKLHISHTISRIRNDSTASYYGKMELDSHADTVVLGKNCIVMQYTGRECDVSPYTDTYTPIRNVPIVTGATAWTCPNTSETFILIMNEALWMGESLDHSLVNPNQLRQYGVSVQDNPYENTPMHIIGQQDEVYIPLQSCGTTIYMDTRTPTQAELHECPHVVLTSTAHWDPNEIQFPSRWEDEFGSHLREEHKSPDNHLVFTNRPSTVFYASTIRPVA